jgi:hypothetical protein
MDSGDDCGTVIWMVSWIYSYSLYSNIICDPLQSILPPDRSEIFFFGILVSIFRGVEMEFQKKSLFILIYFLVLGARQKTSPGWQCNCSYVIVCDK